MALLDGPFEDPMWQTFLARLREETRADFAILNFQPPGWPLDDGLQLISGVSEQGGVASMSGGHFQPSLTVHREWMVEGQVYSLEDLLAFDQDAPQNRSDRC